MARNGTKRHLSRRAKLLIDKLQKASSDYAWVGRGEPEEDAVLLSALEQSKSALCEYINRLENEVEALKRKLAEYLR
jgi:hypothetical protein